MSTWPGSEDACQLQEIAGHNGDLAAGLSAGPKSRIRQCRQKHIWAPGVMKSMCTQHLLSVPQFCKLIRWEPSVVGLCKIGAAPAGYFSWHGWWGTRLQTPMQPCCAEPPQPRHRLIASSTNSYPPPTIPYLHPAGGMKPTDGTIFVPCLWLHRSGREAAEERQENGIRRMLRGME